MNPLPILITLAFSTLLVFSQGEPSTLSKLHTLIDPEVLEQPEQAKGDFLRVLRTEDATLLQTGITRYEKDGVIVDLIGAIHIADKKYYQQLDQEFTHYDSLLFEMVGGEDLADKPNAAAENLEKQQDTQFNLLGKAYDFMANKLALTGQKDGINYQAKNFVHADLTLKEFNDLQKEKDESFYTLFVESMKKSKGTNKDKEDGMALLKALILGDSDGLKLAMIDTLGKGDDEVGALAGSDSVIIGDRNIKCLKVLEQEIARGKKKLGIFYGAAHFPDMEERMFKMGYKQISHRWLNAWDIPKKNKEQQKQPAEPQSAEQDKAA